MKAAETSKVFGFMRIFVHKANMVDSKQKSIQTKSNNYSTDKKTLEAHFRFSYALGP